MGECVLTFKRIEIANQKSDTSHSDNDWMTMVWAINNQVYSKTIPLTNTAGSQVLHTGDLLHPVQDYVICQPTDTVTVVYSIVNLSSFDFGSQAEAAAKFTQGVVDAVVPI